MMQIYNIEILASDFSLEQLNEVKRIIPTSQLYDHQKK
jgi:hypothetical protein